MNKKFKEIKDLIDFLKQEAESCLFSELCALVGLDSENNLIYKKMENRSDKPYHYFIIDAYDYLNFTLENKCLFVFHTHLVGDEKPSEFDIVTSENCCYPFLIYSITNEKFGFYEPHHKEYDVRIIEEIKKNI